MFTENTKIYVMRKGMRRATFALFSDGCYRQVYKNGTMSAICNDFADLFLTLCRQGWKGGENNVGDRPVDGRLLQGDD